METDQPSGTGSVAYNPEPAARDRSLVAPEGVSEEPTTSIDLSSLFPTVHEPFELNIQDATTQTVLYGMSWDSTGIVTPDIGSLAPGQLHESLEPSSYEEMLFPCFQPHWDLSVDTSSLLEPSTQPRLRGGGRDPNLSAANPVGAENPLAGPEAEFQAASLWAARDDSTDNFDYLGTDFIWDIDDQNASLLSTANVGVVHSSIPELGQTNACSANEKTKSKRTRISQQTRKTLEAQLESNPYPSSEEISQLIVATGLEAKKIRTWFNNTRARRERDDCGPSHVPEKEDSSDQILELDRLSSSNLDAMSMSSKESTLSLERFLQAPEESAAIEDIKKATAGILATPTSRERWKQLLAQRNRNPYPPVSGLRNRSNSGSEVGNRSQASRGSSSAGSNCSHMSRGSVRSRRKGVRSYRASPYGAKPTGKSAPGDDLPYGTLSIPKDGSSAKKAKPGNHFCTFCGAAFNSLYTWRRHEESVHPEQVLLTTWVCSHQAQGGSTCLYCDEETVASIEHKCHRCITTSEDERTFYRKDQFKQHVRQVHNPAETTKTSFDLFLKAAERTGAPFQPGDSRLHCGFCGVQTQNWEARIAHVGEHFKKGVSRDDWWPERRNHEIDYHPSKLGTGDGPCKCCYCYRTFSSLAEAWSSHRMCLHWSCSFLPRPSNIIKSSEVETCELCSFCPLQRLTIWAKEVLTVRRHVEEHKLRDCRQHLFYTAADFEKHLISFHGASNSFVGSNVLERFSREFLARFEPISQPTITAFQRRARRVRERTTETVANLFQR